MIVIGSIAYAYATNAVVTTAVLASSLRQSTPLVLGALCGLWCERSGVVNIGIEGQMLFAAFIAFLANVYLGNLIIATIIGALAGATMGALMAFMSVTLKMDQIIGGTIINILAVGLTGYFYVAGLDDSGQVPAYYFRPFSRDSVAWSGFFPQSAYHLSGHYPRLRLHITRFSTPGGGCERARSGNIPARPIRSASMSIEIAISTSLWVEPLPDWRGRS